MSWRTFAEQHDIMAEGLKATPAVGYLGATVAGLSLPDWAAILAIIYTGALLIQLCWRFSKWVKRKGWRDS